MSQSKRHSAIETATNTAVGFVGSYFITFGCFHLNADLATKTLYATLGCTVWSLLRGYYLRRLFNHLHMKRMLAEAKANLPEGFEVGLYDAPDGWRVDWPHPFEADLRPCAKDPEGYHQWPLFCADHTKCAVCGVPAGKRLTGLVPNELGGVNIPQAPGAN